ncbi:DNA-binding protein WhiA [Corynebacterium caspium]|uniref:DNA-binding protein WhiA n=1 Tax=Corynebacterium caspium TaxID=234828 RepID=UPI000365C9BE|nr:DNA-binding protein WhiA [Corynebacterium caspium]WKD59248.1 Putative sporulation transcription regulator WhiA [Corynebacterium caspium DSM 44850]
MVALTARVKDELVNVNVHNISSRLAEIAAIIRYAGEITVAGRNLRVFVEFDHEGAAIRFHDEIQDIFSISPEFGVYVDENSEELGLFYVLINTGAKEVIRRTGLVTRGGTLVVGLPPQVISGTVSDSEAAWRGAFLAAGNLQNPDRTTSLEVACPGVEAALALVGCARRCGISARCRETRTGVRVTIRDGEAIGALLSRLGSQTTRLEWDKRRLRREATSSNNRLVNFDDANLRRSAQAAVAAAARANRAMEILGDEVPEHLAEAGSLRVQYREASLEELGKLAEPPMTKDAIAGRIRRLLSMADKKARELGIPDTKAACKELGEDSADS